VVDPVILTTTASLPGGTVGAAYSQTVTASGGSGTYTYAVTAGSTPTGLSISTGGVLSGTPTVAGSFGFTVTATDAFGSSGSQAYTLVIVAPAVTSVTWTGTISPDWYTAGNWSPNTVPDATINATIPATAIFSPTISSGTANARNLTVSSGATLSQTDGTLTLAANLTNNGTFQPTGGTVSLGGTALSNIVGSGTTRFWNLTVGANGALLATSGGASVQRVLTLNGNFATNGNSFTLESNASNTALVVNNTGNVVTGSVTVQRYIDPILNPGPGYRHYSAPIITATVGSLATAGFTPVVNAAYNSSATPGATTPFPTVYGYDQSRLTTTTNNLTPFDKGFFSPGSLSAPLTVGQGYTVNLAPQTLAVTGTLNDGTLTQNLVSNRDTQPDGGWQLLGNPYPAPLDYSQVKVADRPGLDAAVYVYQSTGQYTGQYRSYVVGIGNPVIPAGQGFFARVSAGQPSGTLTLRNTYRLTTVNNTTVLRTTAETRPLAQLTLKGTSGLLSDDAYVYFENGPTEGFDPQYDAVKLTNTTGLNLSASLPGQQLAIDGLPELGSGQRIVPLAVGVPTPGSYSLTTAQLLNLDTTPVYLRDVQFGTLTDLRLQPSYQFTVSDASVLLTGRFELVFSPQKALATVPAALAQQVALYPNPAKTAAFVELPASLGRQAVTATFVDALGRQLRTVSLPAQGTLAHQLALTELATGVYALRLSTSAGVVVKKLVVE
jgi:hypothetical protein